MSKFRKKPVVVEAVQWMGSCDSVREINLFNGGMQWETTPYWILRVPTLSGIVDAVPGDYIIKGNMGEFYPCKENIFLATYNPEPPITPGAKMVDNPFTINGETTPKDLGITEVRGAKANIPDLQVYGDGDTFALLCKASSQGQGWMKSTKVCNVPGGCVVQVTTQQKNPDGSYAVAEALAYVPGVQMFDKAPPNSGRFLGEADF